MSFYIDNAKQYRDLFSRTFEIPSNREKQKLVVGDLVKLSFRFGTKEAPIQLSELDGERLWVEIVEVNYPWFTGLLDSVPKVLNIMDEPIHFREGDILEICDLAEQDLEMERMKIYVEAHK
jgi:hypothetical protein